MPKQLLNMSMQLSVSLVLPDQIGLNTRISKSHFHIQQDNRLESIAKTYKLYFVTLLVNDVTSGVKAFINYIFIPDYQLVKGITSFVNAVTKPVNSFTALTPLTVIDRTA